LCCLFQSPTNSFLLDPNSFLSTLLSSTLKTYVLPPMCQIKSHTDIRKQIYSSVCLNLYSLRKGNIKGSGSNTRGAMLNFNILFLSLCTQFHFQNMIQKILTAVISPNSLSATPRLLFCAAVSFARQEHIVSFLSTYVETRLHTYYESISVFLLYYLCFRTVINISGIHQQLKRVVQH
jgi:hypothetical protein